MGPEDLLPCLQELATGSYPEPIKCNNLTKMSASVTSQYT